MVGLVWPSIVFEYMNPAQSYTANRPPIQITKVDDQIWWNVPTFGTQVLWLEDSGLDGLAIWIRQYVKLLNQLISQRFIFSRWNNTK